MGDNSRSSNPDNSLRVISEIMERQKEGDKQRVLAKFREAWASQQHVDLSTLTEFGYLGDSGNAIIDAHPFAATDQAIAQVRIAFGIHRAAYESMVKDYGGFHAGLLYRVFPDYNQLSAAITHQVFQFVFSASSLIQAYRRFLSTTPEKEVAFERARLKIFDNLGLSAFVQKLRNCYGHQSIISVVPKSQIRFGDYREVNTNIEFDKSELLRIPDAWNVDARRFIEDSEHLDVMTIVSDYYMSSKELYESYLTETGVLCSYGFTDLARCREARSAVSRIVSLGLVLQIAKKNALNPYSYLARYFSEDELERIYSLPANSIEQINYMITLRDPLNLCDDDLRKKLYELFDG